MVELQVLDAQFQPIDIIDGFTSLVWRRSYYGLGGFTLMISGEYFDLIRRGRYLYRSDAMETGIISGLDYSRQRESPAVLTVTGPFLKALLSSRVLDRVQYLKGKHEDIMRMLVESHAMRPDPARAIPGLFLGDYHGLGTQMEQQATGDNLLDKLHEIGVTAELGCRIRYNHIYSQMQFEVYQGKDRTEGQTENSWATFSPDAENLLEMSYSYNDQDEKNFAYVAGQGENEERIVVTVDCTAGQERKELYVDARDLSMKRQDDTVMTMAEYHALLTQRGLEKLAEHKRVESANSRVDPGANLRYKVDYDLGDKCTVCDGRLGISLEQRITEIEEVYEGGRISITPVFGDGYITISEKLKREVKR